MHRSVDVTHYSNPNPTYRPHIRVLPITNNKNNAR